MHPIKKILIGLGIYPGEMSSPQSKEFLGNNVFDGPRYTNPEVLRRFLRGLGFKETGPDENRFKIISGNKRIEVLLPNQRLLTEEEREQVHRLFEEAHTNEQKEAQSKPKDDDKHRTKKTFAGKGRTQRSKNV